MTTQIIHEEHNDVARFNQLTAEIPTSDFDGLAELLLLLADVIADIPQSDDGGMQASDEQKSALKQIIEASKQHLQSAPDPAIADRLINSTKIFAVDLGLEGDDFSLMHNMLLTDQATEFAVTSDVQGGRADSITGLQQQLEQCLEIAEARELSGIQDIIYLLTEWMENKSEAGLFAPVLTTSQEVVTAIQGYLSGSHSEAAIAGLMTDIDNLDEERLIDADDSALLSSLLLEEATLDDESQPESVTTESATEDSAQSFISLQQQLEQCMETAESQELSGIQDVIYLVTEWLENKPETKLISPEILTSQEILAAIQDYLSGSNSEVAIAILMTRINQLGNEPLIDEDDSQLMSGLLLEEATALKSEAPVEIDVAEELVGDDEVVPDYLQEFVDILLLVHLPLKIILDNIHEEAERLTNPVDKSLLEGLDENFAKFELIAQTAEFFGLYDSCMHVQENLPYLKDEDSKVVLETADLLRQWCTGVLDYLNAPLSKEYIYTLVGINCLPSWKVTIDESKSVELLTDLQNLDRRDDDSRPEERQHLATAENVSLALPDDVSAELVDSLLYELPEQTATFSSAVEQLSEGGSLEDVTVAQRVAHTLKGAGNTVGVKGIANLTHHLEDILTALADENMLPDQVIIGTLQRASDCLEEMTESLTNNSPEPEDAVEVLQEILDLASLIDKEGIKQVIQAVIAPSVFKDESVLQAAKFSEAATEESKESSEQMIRLPVSVVDKLLQFSDEMTINNGQLRNQLKQTVIQAKALQVHLEQSHYIVQELLSQVDLQRIQEIQRNVTSSVNQDFDSLEMDQYNELYSTSLRVNEMTSDSREMNRALSAQLRDIDNQLIEQGYLNDASQDNLLDIRTIPVQSIVSRLQRSVRQAVRMTGKKVEMEIHGADLLIDRDILNGVMDPLMHLLRNAVGHGIEDKQGRLSAGKLSHGNISLTFSQDRNLIVIDCVDDGGGLDLVAIKNKAITVGLISKGAVLSDDELKQLIMQPNFSTQESVSQVSGRGVGMDAVNVGVRALGGTLTVDTETGKGCQFHIQLPMSLAHHNALLIKIGSQTIAAIDLGIEQVLLADAGTLYAEGDEHWFDFEDKKYAVKTIESLLSRVRPNQNIALESRTFLLVHQQENYFAVAVEAITGVKEIIVKELDSVLPKIHGVIGATLQDDGSVAPVMDVQELLQQPALWGVHSDDQYADTAQDELSYALVVDDSLSARRSLEQFFSDMGFQIMAARDGLDAIEQLGERIPDIIVTDLEMPRVNGIELTEHVRSNEQTKDVPIIMITSRATAKHKAMAEDKGVNAYLTKPYSENLLSQTALDLISEHQAATV